ncbi:uncharacterized protein LOC124880871 isoform X1 [Girardinichthys multiradiatus]|uniref:uncharacterized protein LOC124880871 isoform X1 n=2 Tax=Girardinichthys multiradiatus TaxID=208333 RepID=UPI001FACAB17|nr:uncharacterized protein LOC124880871 isoform X1 [Girardinichthys multiradiatus]
MKMIRLISTEVSWEKMICRILLLIILNSCLCAATFVVNVTQSCYQAEENHNITLEWTFTTRPHGSWRQLFILCEVIAPPRGLVLYQVHDGVEVSESQDEQFSGRVQSDKDVLREGRIRLHVSRLRTEDSGLYLCDVKTDEGFNSGKCCLNVSGVADQLQLQRPTLTPETEKWIMIIWITSAAVLVLFIIIFSVLIFICKRNQASFVYRDVLCLKETI